MTLIGKRIKQYRNEKGYSLSELVRKGWGSEVLFKLNRKKLANKPLHSIS